MGDALGPFWEFWGMCFKPLLEGGNNTKSCKRNLLKNNWRSTNSSGVVFFKGLIGLRHVIESCKKLKSLHPAERIKTEIRRCHISYYSTFIVVKGSFLRHVIEKTNMKTFTQRRKLRRAMRWTKLKDFLICPSSFTWFIGLRLVLEQCQKVQNPWPRGENYDSMLLFNKFEHYCITPD